MYIYSSTLLHRFSTSLLYKAVGWNSRRTNNGQFSVILKREDKSKQTIKNASDNELQFGKFSVCGCLKRLGNYICQIWLKLRMIIVHISEEFRSHGLSHSGVSPSLIEILSPSIYLVKWQRVYFFRVSLFGEICLFLFWTLLNKQLRMTTPSNLLFL